MLSVGFCLPNFPSEVKLKTTRYDLEVCYKLFHVFLGAKRKKKKKEKKNNCKFSHSNLLKVRPGLIFKLFHNA